jgi:UDP-GlcNAc:undecaprenyl-phosphate GlcNAc-1-phosphate transferase
MNILLALIISAAITMISVLPACRLKIIDQPNARKIHTISIPRTGGIAIFAGFVIAVLCSAPLSHSIRFIAPIAIAWITGLVDDIYELKPRIKLVFEAVASLIAIFLGFRFNLTNTVLDYIVTFIWYIGYMNAFNLIDGLDGLATTVAIFQALAISITALLAGTFTPIGPIAPALIGSCLGFLVFNWHPAKIFMGDSGSLFIGLTIALLGVTLQQSLPQSLALGGIFNLCSIVFYPLFDTFLSIYRRVKRGVPIFTADRSHSYNLLVDFYGLKQTTVIWLVMASNILVAGVSIIALYHLRNPFLVILVPLCAFILGAMFTRKAGFAYVDEGNSIWVKA